MGDSKTPGPTPPGKAPESETVPKVSGQHNDISFNPVAPFLPSSMGQKDLFSDLTRLMKDFYRPNALEGQGPWLGTVLANMGQEAQAGEEPTQATGWEELLGETIQLKKYRVRVDALHAHIPVPLNTAENIETVDEASRQLIDLHPIFPAQSTDVEGAAVGDLVWVDFKNRQNFKDPFYIGPVNAGGASSNPGGSSSKPPNSKDKHNKACKKRYERDSAEGDGLAGSTAVLEPHQGLPRLSRHTKEDLEQYKLGSETKEPLDHFKIISSDTKPGNQKALKQIKTAFKIASKWKMKAWYGELSSNGPSDPKHDPNARSTIILVPEYFDKSQPWELIYWFHGLKGFKQYNFEKRYFPQLNKLQEAGRNFVFVVPELPWSWWGTKTKRQAAAWVMKTASTSGGDFNKFHTVDVPNAIASLVGFTQGDVQEKLDDAITVYNHPNTAKDSQEQKDAEANIEKFKKLKENIIPSYVTIVGHSNGGSALASAANEGALSVAKPDKIYFSDSDYGWDEFPPYAVKKVYDEYIKKSEKPVLMIMTTIPGQKPRSFALKFMKVWEKEPKALKAKHHIYHIGINTENSENSKHGYCAETALLTLPKEYVKLIEEKEKEAEAADAIDKMGKAIANQTQDEKAEAEETEAEAPEGDTPPSPNTKDIPPKPPKVDPAETKADPPPQGPPAPAGGANPVKADTAKGDPPKPKFKLHPAVPYSENRVKVKEYGGTLASNSPHLVDIGNGKKAHVLLANRWKKMKAAMIKDGLTEEGVINSKGKSVSGTQLRIASGWRAHKWKNDYNYYLNFIKTAKTSTGQPKYASVKEGKKAIAFASPHETGLAIDILGWGIPSTNTGGAGEKAKAAKLAKDLKTKLGKWLKDHAYEYGFTPYKAEAWHWEVKVPIENWISGEEFTDDYAVRIDSVGKPGKSQVGSSSGKSGTSGKAPCIIVPGKFDPGPDSEPLILDPKDAAKAPNVHQGAAPKHIAKKGPKNLWPKLMKFCVHETAGWPNNLEQRKKSQLKTDCGITFWTNADGTHLQTQHVLTKIWHCQSGAWNSTGTEMCVAGPMGPYMYGGGAKWIDRGFHIIGRDGQVGYTKKWKDKNGNVIKKEKRTAVSTGMYDIAGYKGYKGPLLWMIPRPIMAEAVWQLIYSLVYNPPDVSKLPQIMHRGKKIKPTIDMKIAFPAVNPKLGVFTFDSWAGEPVKFNQANRKRIGDWWESRKDELQGIFCHWDCGFHGDGKFGVYYCMARAGGMNPDNAYYATVGACTSVKTDGKGGVPKGIRYAPMPKDGMVAKGQAKYPWPLKAKTIVDIPTWRSWKNDEHMAKWNQMRSGKKWCGDPNKPT